MNNVTSRSFLPAVALLIAASLIPSPAQADCTAPAAVEGTIEYFSAQQIFKYCDGTSWNFLGSGGGTALSGITAATGANSINNADYAQTLNWQLTTNDKDAFTFTENTASTATGHSSLLKASTLATSTATPLMVTNLGNAPSFRVNDATGDADTTPFVIDASGNVGIGTTAPATLLQLHTATGSFPKIRFTAADVTLPSYAGSGSIDDVSASNTFGQIRNRMDGGGVQTGGMLVQGFTGSGVNNFYPLHLVGTHGGTAPTTAAVTIAGQKWNGTSNRAALTSTTPVLDVENNYGTAATTGLLFRIMGDGKVGVGGVAAPTYPFEIHSNNQNTLYLRGANNSPWANPEIAGDYSRGTLAARAIVQANDEVIEMAGRGWDGDTYEIAADIRFEVDGTPGNGDMPGRMVFYTTPDGSAAYTERMRINNAGNVGIGTPTPATKLHVAAGSIRFDLGVYGVDFSGAANNGIKTLAGDNHLSMYGLGNLNFYNDTDNTSAGTEGTFFYGGAAAGTTPTPLMALLNGGNVGIGTTSPQSTLHVPDGKYAQFEDNNAGAPPAGDCDNNAERGRMSIDTTNNLLYVCNGATRGWDYIEMTD